MTAYLRPYEIPGARQLGTVVASSTHFYGRSILHFVMSGPFETKEQALDWIDKVDNLFVNCPVEQVGAAAQAAMSIR